MLERARLGRPDAAIVVCAPRSEQLAVGREHDEGVGRERDEGDRRGVALERVELLVSLRVPDADCCVVRAGREFRAVRRPHSRVHDLGVPNEHAELVALLGVPNGNLALSSSTDEAEAVRGKFQVPDEVNACLPLANDAPEDDSRVVATARHPHAVGRGRHATDVAVWSGQSDEGLPL